MKNILAFAIAVAAMSSTVPASFADSEAQMSGGSEATTQNSSSASSQHASEAQTQNTSHASRQSSSQSFRHSSGPRVVNNVSRIPHAEVRKIDVSRKSNRNQ